MYATASSSDSEYFLECFHPLSHFGTCARTVSCVINFGFFAFSPFQFLTIYLFISCMPVSVCVWTCICHGVPWCGGEKTTFRSQFSPSPVQVPGIKFMWSDIRRP